MEIVSSFVVSFTEGEILESDDQRKTDRHHEIEATVLNFKRRENRVLKIELFDTKTYPSLASVAE